METEKFKPLNLKDTIEILIKYYNLHEGLYDLAFEIQIGVGNFGPNPENQLPGAAIGVGGIKLIKSTKVGQHTVDAAVVNPAPKRTASTRTTK
jgi:hypothetical protein